MSLSVKDLRRFVWVALGLSLTAATASAETMNANKQPTGAVTNPPVNPFDPWDGGAQPAFNPWKGGVATEQAARLDSPCGNCDTDWCNTNYGTGYGALPLPAWTDLPPWYVGADGLFLSRINTNNLTFATTGRLGHEAITTEDFDYELRPGVRLALGRTINDYFRIEGTYFGQHYWDDSVTVRNTDPNAQGTTGNLFSPFSGFGDPIANPSVDFNNLVTIDTTSELDSAEVNLRYRAPVRCGAWEMIVLCGVRYLRIDETFGYLSNSSPPQLTDVRANLIEVETTNDLIGGQIGGNIIYRASERWWINFDGKAGVFGNSARQNTVFMRTLFHNNITSYGQAQEGTTAFVGDIKIESCFQLFPRLTIVAGYNVIGVDGLALAAPNVQEDLNLLTLGPADLNHNSTLIYHGPHAGIVWSW